MTEPIIATPKTRPNWRMPLEIPDAIPICDNGTLLMVVAIKPNKPKLGPNQITKTPEASLNSDP
ncbi:hypothetical protein [Coxiella burnetii]|uniref:hypothetical protein n=1 Tax=Coxiella burnetii TaxID=777 RepID=UPI001E60BD4A|nr:hypothetical protein [Coxiella burnetii]MCF2096279.1 hypothetical protein [Coxiella burnetii]MCF2098307.1 hypothetical protein [Coxiella burnetii]MCF2099035.1 hypothetical protein [Coxiella burnetii]MCF2101308.1 hypothetical protein [Coxiella burnetii]MCF2103449.1 hypothetical protein [Coxiella burnetii]